MRLGAALGVVGVRGGFGVVSAVAVAALSFAAPASADAADRVEIPIVRRRRKPT